MSTDLTVANTILRQLTGGHSLNLMIGSKYQVGDESSLCFDFQGCTYANKCRIILEETDTYTVEFYKSSKRLGTCQRVQWFNDVYADGLTSLFEHYTGLYLFL